ncbi:MAG: FAD-binding protein [Candidatus Tectomicrobia bacterium]|uniref:FAD-binding protein n=1 Tax=Tectimicrobiota bacterium TaxID=2528274 RepID=A0A932CM31_UNCTE|nr:FAD-binding protein [Candidatus Tectomicrobia bacterium]
MKSNAHLERVLRERVRGEVRFDETTRILYSTDASNYQILPIGVVLPQDLQDVEAVVQLAAAEGVPLLPRGAGTSLAGQTVGTALVIDFSKYMNCILELDLERKRARVQPGVRLSQLHQATRPHGLVFGPDPATANRCNLGGMIGNNSCGARSLAYGKTVDRILSLTCLLADGTRAFLGPLNPGRPNPPGREGRAIPEQEKGGRQGSNGSMAEAPVHNAPLEQIAGQVFDLVEQHRALIEARYPKIPRRVSGYNLDALLAPDGNLAHLIVGAEGTLATVVEAELELAHWPTHRGLVLLGFRELLLALEAVSPLLGLCPTALEIVDDQVIAATSAAFGPRKAAELFIPGVKGLLLVEFAYDDPEETRAAMAQLAQAAPRLPGSPEARLLPGRREQEAVWAVREAALGLVGRKVGDSKPIPFVEDAAVSPEQLAAYVWHFQQIASRHGAAFSLFGHAGHACLHIRPHLDLKRAEGVKTMRVIAEEVADLVASFGGSLSGEHGDGFARSELLSRMFGPEILGLFREVKRIFDPQGIMNPGKIVDPLPLDANLRYGPAYAAHEPRTYFDFSDLQGFTRAVEMCNGLAACRKLESGTMCPSYQVTREEMHTTRARANALREAMRGNLDGLGDARVIEVLDLCLACKGCQRECPIGVDMATYKAEYLAHYQEIHGIPWSARAFGYLPRLARLGSRMPRLANAILRSPLQGPIKRWAGLHPARKLPALAPESFRRWFARRPQGPEGDRPPLLLFDDTFNGYFRPESLKAATELLERVGYRVLLPPRPVCCGRPLISKGLLRQARAAQQRLLDVLYPLVQQGIPVVGLEPSCLLTFRDELPRLTRDRRARALAENSFLLEEFLVQEVRDYRPGRLPGRALVHGHCHQKAISGMEPVEDLLGRLEGLEFRVLDSGCCGMAGSFGYERGHYEVSRACGERVLLPAVRELGPEGWVVADGFSCRSQIADFTGREALHVAELLLRAQG